jgi:hypothetical protein
MRAGWAGCARRGTPIGEVVGERVVLVTRPDSEPAATVSSAQPATADDAACLCGCGCEIDRDLAATKYCGLCQLGIHAEPR